MLASKHANQGQVRTPGVRNYLRLACLLPCLSVLCVARNRLSLCVTRPLPNRGFPQFWFFVLPYLSP